VQRLLWQLTMRCFCCVVVVTMICDLCMGHRLGFRQGTGSRLGLWLT
jgi:hypothetical protein